MAISATMRASLVYAEAAERRVLTEAAKREGVTEEVTLGDIKDIITETGIEFEALPVVECPPPELTTGTPPIEVPSATVREGVSPPEGAVVEGPPLKETEMSELGKEALNYVSHGWYVFPLAVRSKKPREGSEGFKDATTDVEQIRAWWAENPQYNIGIATGASGLVVVDVDPDKGGKESWAKLGVEIPDGCLVSRTPRGGYHIVFAALDGEAVKCSEGKLGPGLDIRGEGGYIVAPPSVLHKGGYTWSNDCGSRVGEVLPAFPVELVARLEKASATVEEVGAPIPKGQRNKKLTVIGGLFRREGLDEGDILAGLLRVNTLRCQPPLDDQEVRKIARSVVQYDPASEIRCTDLGNAQWFAKLHGDKLRYVAAHKCWLVWNGKQWAADDTHQVTLWAEHAVRELYKRLSAITDSGQRKAATRHVLNSEGKARIDAMVGLGKAERAIAARPGDFDGRDTNWLLNVNNGTIDLKTGTLRPHRREDMITKLAPVDWDADAKCPKWDAFLERITGGDAELVGYLQRSAGYALTADTGEHVIFFLYGTGANGKSTFLEALRATAGTYAQVMSSETIAKSRGGQGGRARSDLVRLKGARLVTTIETEAGRRLAEALVKQLTGGDTIVARPLYAAEVEFMPSHKIFLATNHKPIIRGTDWAMWRRVRLIPFEQVIPEEERIRNYFDVVLRDELPGILRWATEGCLEWQRAGLRMPEPVVEATKVYRAEMDRVGQFITDECFVESDERKGLRVGAQALFTTYQEWCKEEGVKWPLPRTRFFGVVEERFEKKRLKGGWHFLGLQPRLGLPDGLE